MRRLAPLFLSMVALALLPASLIAQHSPAIPGQDADLDAQRGAQVFAQLCAVCHGAEGGGDGPMALLLDPRPRDFGLATFHVVSTDNRIPSDEDLLDTLRLGMVGTAMPGWGHLPEADLQALVVHLRELMVQRRLEEAAGGRASRTPEQRKEAERAVRLELTPGARVPIGPAPPSTAERIQRGREVWVASCAECHGDDGRGGVRDDLVDIRGAPSRPRDMTRGLFRGSDEPVELARRITLGMPGTAMPAFELPPDDLWAVVSYVGSLVKPGAQQDLLQFRRTLVAPRLEAPLIADAGREWQFVPQVRLPLMPYTSDLELVEPLVVQVAHDGTRFAVRVRWEDAAPGAEPPGAPELVLKLSAEEEPPVVSAHGDTSRIWRWKAGDAALQGQPGTARGIRTDDGWDVIFVDTLGVGEDREASFRPGETLRLQLTLRVGGSRTRAMTIWHAVELKP